MTCPRSSRGAALFVLVAALLFGGCWGRSFFRAPGAALETRAAVDSLLGENALLQRRIHALEQQVREMRDYDRTAAARSMIDLEEIKDELNALRQFVRDDGQSVAFGPFGGPVTGDGPAEEPAPDSLAAYADSAAVDSAVVDSAAVPPPREIYRQVYLDYSRGAYELAIEESTAFLDVYAGHPLAEEVLFIRGECFTQLGRHFDALNEFARIRREFPSGRRTPAVLLRMADSYEKIGEEAVAAGIVRQLLREYPYSEEAAAARERFESLLEN